MNAVGSFVFDDSTKEEYLNYTPDLQYYALLAGRELYASSALGGTHWQLVSLNLQDIELKASPEDALKSDSGLWCELHFFSCGGASITLKAAPLLRSRLGLEFQTEIKGVAWSESNGALQFAELYIPSHTGYDYSAEITDAACEGDTLTIRLKDGTLAVFRRSE